MPVVATDKEQKPSMAEMFLKQKTPTQPIAPAGGGMADQFIKNIKKKDVAGGGETSTTPSSPLPSTSEGNDLTKGINFQQGLQPQVQAQSKKPAIYTIADIAKKQNEDDSLILSAAIPSNFPAGQPNTAIQQNIDNSKEKDVLAGNPDAVTSVIQRQQEELKKQKGIISEKYGLTKDVPSVYPQYKQEVDDLAQKQKDIIEAGVSALNTIYANKFDNSPDKSANVQAALGQELRSQKAKIGADFTFADQQAVTTKKKIPAPQGIILLPGSQTSTVAKVASDNVKLSDPINNEIKRSGQEYEYTNRGTLLNATAEQKKSEVDDLMQQPKVQQYINGDEQQRAELQNDPVVQQAIQSHKDLISINEQANGLINQYPQVKAQVQSQQVANAFANYVSRARKGDYGDFVKTVATRGLFDPVRLNQDYEIKRVAELSGLPEDVVTKYANEAKIPSYLGLATRGFGDVLKDTEQGLNRLTLPKSDAEVQNKLIEDTKYHTPESLQLSTKNINPDSILSTMFSTIGQVAAYGLTGYLGGEVLGAASGVTKVANLAKADLATLNAAEQILPANALSKMMVNMGVSDTEGQALSQIVNATAKAKNISGTYSSMYAASYEAAYQEAAKFTADEDKRKEYADSMATANGLAMVVLNPSNLISKSIHGILPETAVGDYLKTGEAISSKQIIKDRLAEIGKTTSLGVTQSLIPVINDAMAKSEIFDYHTSSSEFFNQAVNSAMNMAIGILPLGILGASKQPSSEYLKSSLYQVGTQPEAMRSRIEQSFTNGEFTNEEKNRQISVINTISDLVNHTPDKDVNGESLTQQQKNNLVYLQLQHDALIKKQESASASMRPSFDTEISGLQEQIDKIVTPKEKEPEKTETFDAEKTIVDEAQKGNLVSMYNNLINADPTRAKDVLLDYAKQKYGVSDDGSSVGDGRVVENKQVDKAVAASFPDKQSVIDEVKYQNVNGKGTVVSESISPILKRINDADYINEKELDQASNKLYDYLDEVDKSDIPEEKKKSISNLVEPLITKIENYDFRTKTETSTVTETVPDESAGTPAKRKIRPALEQAEGSPSTITTPEGETIKGELKIKDGKYVLEVSGGESRDLGEKAITDRDLKLPTEEEMANPISFDKDGNVESVTFKTRDGDLVRIEDPEKALDLAIQIRAEMVGDIPDKAFNIAYKEVQKEVSREVMVKQDVAQPKIKIDRTKLFGRGVLGDKKLDMIKWTDPLTGKEESTTARTLQLRMEKRDNLLKDLIDCIG